MLATKKDVSWQVFLFFLFLFELSPAMNPLLLYILDARLRTSLDEFFQIVSKTPTLPISSKVTYISRPEPSLPGKPIISSMIDMDGMERESKKQNNLAIKMDNLPN